MVSTMKLFEVSLKLVFTFLMLCAFKWIDDVLHLPLQNILFMATSWQIILAITYLLISMIWKNDIHKTGKYDLYFGILHANALFMTLSVTLIFWSGFIIGKYILKKDQITMHSLSVPVIYLHLQHTLPLTIMIIDLFLFKNWNHTFHKQGHCKYLIYSLFSTITYMITIYIVHLTIKRIQGKIFWPYPFMNKFTEIHYILFCGVMMIPLLVLCLIQRYFHLLIVKDPTKQKTM